RAAGALVVALGAVHARGLLGGARRDLAPVVEAAVEGLGRHGHGVAEGLALPAHAGLARAALEAVEARIVAVHEIARALVNLRLQAPVGRAVVDAGDRDILRDPAEVHVQRALAALHHHLEGALAAVVRKALREGAHDAAPRVAGKVVV